MSKWIRKDDKVKVISGNHKGMTGVVLSRKKDKVIVQGINFRKKSVKKSEDNPQGGFVELERPIHISNVMLCVDEDRPAKVRVKRDAEGNKELYYLDAGKPKTFRLVKK